MPPSAHLRQSRSNSNVSNMVLPSPRYGYTDGSITINPIPHPRSSAARAFQNRAPGLPAGQFRRNVRKRPSVVPGNRHRLSSLFVKCDKLPDVYIRTIPHSEESGFHRCNRCTFKNTPCVSFPVRIHHGHFPCSLFFLRLRACLDRTTGYYTPRTSTSQKKTDNKTEAEGIKLGLDLSGGVHYHRIAG